MSFDYLPSSLQLPATLGPFVSPTAAWGLVVVYLQLIAIAIGAFFEMKYPTAYSKFATSKATMPSRIGMLILYVPSMLLAFYMTLLVQWQTRAQTQGSTLVSMLVFGHFGKRVLETLFLHKYSGTMDAATSILGGIGYSLSSHLIISTAQSQQLATYNQDYKQLGLALFTVGELGNLYHHYLLRQLRSNYSNKKDNPKMCYVAPTGGFFDFVACPHYFFEVIAFTGIACCSQHLHALLMALIMLSYLMGRAMNTLQFYQQRFDKHEWSPEKKAMIPFIF